MRMVKLPAGCIITGGYLASTDLDTAASPTITMTVGLMDIADTTLDANTDLLAESTVGRQGGTMAAFSTGLTQGPFTVDKFVAVLGYRCRDHQGRRHRHLPGRVRPAVTGKPGRLMC
ncbi:hypothetical protein [Solidesulfovibrio sp.]